uniref:Uncharacterized protein n=1 Tax=Caenorhabditis japonica TaxID=281687 RepID=A0A8R1ENU0_CAEJA
MPDTIEFIEPKEHSLDVYNDYENPHTTPAETVNKWMTLSYRLFGTMLENSEYSFFLSTPQLISQLSFLMTVCQEKTTGLRREFGWIPNSSILAHQIQHKNLLENTINFMKRWRGEMQAASLPGKIRSARRALCYPTNAVLFHLSTLQALKTHHIEMKIFEGAKENRAWLRKIREKCCDKCLGRGGVGSIGH